MAHADLFGGLEVRTRTGSTPASRVDIGWAAWRSVQPEADAKSVLRWRYWLALWRHFGQAQFFVHIDDSYHTATSVRVRLVPKTGDLEVLLIQTDSWWQLLLSLRRWHKDTRALSDDQPTSTRSTLLRGQRKCIHGRLVQISRYPVHLEVPSLPSLVKITGFNRTCPEVTLDLQRHASLPLEIHSTR